MSKSARTVNAQATLTTSMALCKSTATKTKSGRPSPSLNAEVWSLTSSSQLQDSAHSHQHLTQFLELKVAKKQLICLKATGQSMTKMEKSLWESMNLGHSLLPAKSDNKWFAQF